MKTLFIVDIITDYRITFFEKLADSNDGEVLVLNSKSNSSDGRPETKKKLTFPNKSLNKKQISFLGIDFFYYQNLVSIIKDFSPDIIVIPGEIARISNWQIITLKFFFKYKVIIWACHWLSGKGLKLTLKKYIYQIFYSFGSRILTYSSKAKNDIDLLLGNNLKTLVCQNALDHELLENQMSSNKDFYSELLLKKENKTILLYVGAMRVDKKVDLLIDSYQQSNFSSKDSELWLVGDGPELNSLKYKYSSIKNVVFFGRETDKANCYFSVADLFILPGIGGLALNQSMYWSTPCIVHEGDGTEKDLVHDSIDGYFFDGTEYGLVNTINCYYHLSEHERKEMAIKSKKVINKITIENMVSLFISTFKKLY